MNLVDLFWGIWKISLAKYTGWVCRDKEHQANPKCQGVMGGQGPHTATPAAVDTTEAPSPTCSR